MEKQITFDPFTSKLRFCCPSESFFSTRLTQRELENQKAQEFRFQQQMKKLENEIKQNEILIKKCQMTQKSTKVSPLLSSLFP